MIETPHHQNYSVDDLRSYLDSRPNTPGGGTGNYSAVNSPIWPSSPAWPRDRESMAGSTLALNPQFAEPDSPGFPPNSPGFPPNSPGPNSPGFQGEKEQPKAAPARPPGPPGGPPPDGGLTAWLQVVGGHFLFMNTWGIINAYGMFWDVNFDKNKSTKQQLTPTQVSSSHITDRIYSLVTNLPLSHGSELSHRFSSVPRLSCGDRSLIAVALAFWFSLDLALSSLG